MTSKVWVLTQAEPEGRNKAPPEARLRAAGVSAGYKRKEFISLPCRLRGTTWSAHTKSEIEKSAESLFPPLALHGGSLFLALDGSPWRFNSNMLVS